MEIRFLLQEAAAMKQVCGYWAKKKKGDIAQARVSFWGGEWEAAGVFKGAFDRCLYISTKRRRGRDQHDTLHSSPTCPKTPFRPNLAVSALLSPSNAGHRGEHFANA